MFPLTFSVVVVLFYNLAADPDFFNWFTEAMGGDHHAAYKVPDWRTYTVGEHTPELLKNERMLKSLGLKVSVFVRF
jgi:hypothetical protein